ncbi:MAG: DctP family TRAP transporter solute-binding subunit [Ornithinimicrobium sp.]|uniref:DctP family TRAP transporter solute-binding subunit n=1 Tax=Ornithinimicrobium sp. TaxID=1977084 RepID=UPI0026E07C6D|nr:DctP family TRAP transporter solute-binding subunit [Ornithinimicrobium sp.]MDO5739985.1 DctP family TRAP transporter solute-binding subunit [Ornithinimicrobium sp.]
MTITIRPRRTVLAAVLTLPLVIGLSACGGDTEADTAASDGTSTSGDGAAAQEEVTLKLAHSYTEEQPQHRCGAAVIAEEVAASDVGLTIDIFPSSQLGGDADRISAVVAGDIDMDIQGASALGAVYEPIGILDAAYAFEDGPSLSAFVAGDASEGMRTAFADASGVNVLGAWSAGARQFTANTPIRTPEDLDGLRMRFPNSPQFLMNAKALGASATEVAYEELYLALQQGTVDGQENPIVNIDAINLDEVQEDISLSNHQLNSNLVIVGPVWDKLSDEQQSALQGAVDAAVEKVPACVEESEQKILQEWKESGAMEVIEDVDVESFRTKARAYFEENLKGETLDLYTAIMDSSTR